MKNQDFDKYFKENAQNRNFDFDESYWSEMETLIEQEEVSEKGGFWKQWWKGAVGVAVILLIGHLIWSPFKEEEQAARQTTKIESNTQDISGIQAQNEEQFVEQDVEREENQEEIIDRKDNKVIYSPTKQKEGNAFSTKENALNDLSNNPIINKNKENIASNNNTERQRTVKQKQSEQQQEGLMNSSGEHSDVNPKGPPFIQNSKSENTSSQKPVAQLTPVPKGAKVSNDVIEEWVYLASLPVEDLAIVRTAPQKIINVQPTDTSGNDENNSKKPLLSINKVGIIGGGQLYQGFLNLGDQRVPFETQPFGGVYASTKINNKVEARVGLNYWQRGALNSAVAVDSVVYGFGATVYTQKVNIYQIQYLEMPITFIYNSNKHLFTGGLQLNYMLNGKGIYQRTVSDAFQTTTENEIDRNGYQTAFNRFDIGLALGYERHLTKQVYIGGQIQTGLLDVTKNAIFNNTTFDRNGQFKVYLRYELKLR